MKLTKYAYVYLIMKGNRYVNGVIVSAYCLRKYGNTNNIIVMVTNDVSKKEKNKLSKFVDFILEIPYISCNINFDKNKVSERVNLTMELYDWMNVSFTKWNCLQLTNYEKIIFIDADTLPISYIDDIFEKYNAPAGIISTRLNINPDIPNKNNGKITSDKIKKMLKNKDHIFSASFILLKPGNYDKFITSLNSGKTNKCNFYKKNEDKYTKSGEDEVAITKFFSEYDWDLIPSIYCYIDYGKHTDEYLYPYTKNDVKIYTFTGDIKPWEIKEAEYEDMKIYQNIMKEIYLKYKIKLYKKPPKKTLEIMEKRNKYREKQKK